MITKEQQNTLKDELYTRKKQIIEQNEKSEDYENTELSNYDNHPADNATDLFEREKDLALEEHTQKELDDINDALNAMEEGTYGLCAVGGEDIPFERLEAMPTALTCVEHAEEYSSTNQRPSEESVISPSSDHPYRGEDEGIRDYENSFDEAARYGTSETPSDMANGEESYDDLYEEDVEDEDVANEMDGKHRKILPDNE
ncbi:TraR/DksA C4-type zinc finger protein [Jeotgalibacillus haloalkalitolerans]|uniref:TraR/DksA C4-type zinc finger protein n=1 Tax=Jeotgalibacillus haloalkalitolerans TaxID=3104292 RepID=A0ABU5KMS5_9BACL|nr:TraR/DksA C4-type zinc finger protein [Jeotgalibacillus sp. HH7-29]MDZ5712566.1 TraR/DksA C4-type zinc finger protein [Jeotgalibacillus sp. HH7-29]